MSQTFGRPRLEDGTRRDAYVGVPVTAEMHDRLVRVARAAGYRSLSSYVRQRLFAPVCAGIEGPAWLWLWADAHWAQGPAPAPDGEQEQRTP